MNAKLKAVILVVAGFNADETAEIAGVPLTDAKRLSSTLTLRDARIVAASLTSKRGRWPSKTRALRILSSLWIGAAQRDREHADTVLSLIQVRLADVGSEVLQ